MAKKATKEEIKKEEVVQEEGTERKPFYVSGASGDTQTVTRIPDEVPNGRYRMVVESVYVKPQVDETKYKDQNTGEPIHQQGFLIIGRITDPRHPEHENKKANAWANQRVSPKTGQMFPFNDKPPKGRPSRISLYVKALLGEMPIGIFDIHDLVGRAFEGVIEGKTPKENGDPKIVDIHPAQRIKASIFATMGFETFLQAKDITLDDLGIKTLDGLYEDELEALKITAEGLG